MQKFLPKNEIINKAIAIDNRDSVLQDRLDEAKKQSQNLHMGNLLKNGNNQKGEENQDQNEIDVTEGFESGHDEPVIE
jgi:hypothetical protein